MSHNVWDANRGEWVPVATLVRERDDLAEENAALRAERDRLRDELAIALNGLQSILGRVRS